MLMQLKIVNGRELSQLSAERMKTASDSFFNGGKFKLPSGRDETELLKPRSIARGSSSRCFSWLNGSKMTKISHIEHKKCLIPY